MAAACGTAAANIYYNQPLLGDFAKQFNVDPSRAGLVATASQVGYGIGILFFVPLGDLLERRRVVLTLAYACTLLLVCTGAASSLTMLIIAQGLVGITAMSAQLLIPLAVDLSPPHKRGHTVGVLMAGLLCGLLLARTLGGFVGDHFGWRAMFYLAAGIMFATGVVLHLTLPHRRPTLSMNYGQLMTSLIDLLRTQPTLRRASLISGASFASFTAFWTTLSFLMHDRFGRGATEAGLFGVIGLAGALAAPLAGKLSDRRGPAFTVTIAMLLSIASFVLMAGWVSIAGLIVGVLLLDLGVQSVQVAAQSEVMALVPDARSRLNTIYMVARFIGGAAGSAAGAFAYTHGGWTATCAAAIGVLVVGTIVHLAGTRRT
ncbi:MAG TPA: MFS transporter [Tepidisphaeraceae bacterium]|jgi:predicted MFS family arabinose efflux permease